MSVNVRMYSDDGDSFSVELDEPESWSRFQRSPGKISRTISRTKSTILRISYNKFWFFASEALPGGQSLPITFSRNRNRAKYTRTIGRLFNLTEINLEVFSSSIGQELLFQLGSNGYQNIYIFLGFSLFFRRFISYIYLSDVIWSMLYCKAR